MNVNPTDTAEQRPNIDWPDLLTRIRRKVRQGAEKVEFHVPTDKVRGFDQVGNAEGPRGA